MMICDPFRISTLANYNIRLEIREHFGQEMQFFEVYNVSHDLD